MLGLRSRAGYTCWRSRRLAPATPSRVVEPMRGAFSSSTPALGLEQLQDVPLSTDRKPRGFHRGPGKRQTSEREAETYRFIKKWDLQMQESWDPLEPFHGLPKPKKVLGNEATEIIWPYATLLERCIKVHPFTKSIYVYYSHSQGTESGRWAAAAAKAFSHGYLVPITFHNSHVYVETEMLVEYNETPWVVVHCLDGRHEIIPVSVPPPTESSTPATAAASLLGDVVAACDRLGSSVRQPREVTRLLNERPLQNQYLRIDYQWFGDTPEERASHLVQWDVEPADSAPMLRQRNRHVLNWLNFDGGLPTAAAVHVNVKREKARMQLPRTVGGPKSFFNAAGSRANARNSRFGENK